MESERNEKEDAEDEDREGCSCECAEPPHRSFVRKSKSKSHLQLASHLDHSVLAKRADE